MIETAAAIVDTGERARNGKRRGNEALLAYTARQSSLAEPSHERIPFSCECRAVGCSEIVWMAASDFRELAHAPGIALVASGHSGGDERVIARSVGYLLVQRR